MKVFAPDWQKHCIQAAYEKQPFSFAISRAPFETTLNKLLLEIQGYFNEQFIFHRFMLIYKCFHANILHTKIDAKLYPGK